MFIVKAMFRGETRKLSFPDDAFPSYEELCNQLYRVFPVDHRFYIFKLLFFPQGSGGGRILLGREVHNEGEYTRCINSHKDRLWPHGLLRFSVCDGTTPRAAINPTQLNYTTDSLSWTTEGAGPSTRGLDADMEENARSLISHTSAQNARSEFEKLMAKFKDDLGQILEHNLSTIAPVSSVKPSTRPLSSNNLESETYAPLCSICTERGLNACFTCESCHIIVCSKCSRTRTSLCFSTLGAHRWSHYEAAALSPSTAVVLLSNSSTPGVSSAGTPMGTNPHILRNPTSCTRPVPHSPQDDPSTRINPRNPQGPIHRGIVCDNCEGIIQGVRHKCLDCPDFDLCTGCLTSGGATRHNPFHEFFDITEPGRVIVHTVNDNRQDRQDSPVEERAAEVVLHFATCDLCDSRIQGDRYKCSQCPDFDVCSSCFSITQTEHPQHNFVRIKRPDDLIQRESAPRALHFANCNVCSKQIFGVRYKCLHPNCIDFDLCDVCEAHPIPVHPANHPLLKIKTPDAFIPVVSHSVPPVGSAPPNQRMGQRRTSEDDIRVEVGAGPPHTTPEHAFLWGYMHPPSVTERSTNEVPEAATGTLVPRLDEISPIINRFVTRTPSPSRSLEARCPQREYSDFNIDSREILNTMNMGPESAQNPVEQQQLWPGTASELAHLLQSAILLDNAPPAFVAAHLEDHDHNDEESPSNPFVTRDMQQRPSPLVTLAHRATPLETPLSSFMLARLSEPSERDASQDSDIAQNVILVEESASAQSETAVNDIIGAQTEEPHRATQMCLTAMFLEDLTVQDGQVFPPGAEFMKSWKMMNDSVYDWPQTTELVYVAGESLGMQKDTVVHVGRVQAGAQVELWTGELKAPDVAGRYVSYWKLRTGDKQLFGDSIWIDIIVADSDDSDKSIASSLIIMPQGAPEREHSERSLTSSNLLTEIGNKSTLTGVTSVQSISSSDGIGSDTDSEISLVSVPSSNEEFAWHDVASVGERTSQRSDYVYLYDDRSSEGE